MRYPQMRMVIGPGGLAVGHIVYDLTELGYTRARLVVYDPPEELLTTLWRRAADGHIIYDQSGPGTNTLAETDAQGVFISGPYLPGSYISP